MGPPRLHTPAPKCPVKCSFLNRFVLRFNDMSDPPPSQGDDDDDDDEDDDDDVDDNCIHALLLAPCKGFLTGNYLKNFR